ncbi:hypothetical protein [Aminobacter sp. MDW-2]|uniref:hypothetical protein n=1 Tax=Aminobacter sp. MDW-2 TaxID=2666139 RepID=UPI0012AF98DD|nr:hypothetical protein [Aminobacter sp. MDW-2]MRX37187.1 hypothetical protein [Aminobacter sp. MDW-2]QNH33264.1 hypothetical protein H5P29_22540 [Aminobacter sp. MDW-2]
MAKAGVVLRSTRNRRVDAIFPSAWTTTRLPIANDAGRRGHARWVGGCSARRCRRDPETLARATLRAELPRCAGTSC